MLKEINRFISLIPGFFANVSEPVCRRKSLFNFEKVNGISHGSLIVVFFFFLFVVKVVVGDCIDCICDLLGIWRKECVFFDFRV